jgi:hypothetical protein
MLYCIFRRNVNLIPVKCFISSVFLSPLCFREARNRCPVSSKTAGPWSTVKMLMCIKNFNYFAKEVIFSPANVSLCMRVCLLVNNITVVDRFWSMFRIHLFFYFIFCIYFFLALSGRRIICSCWSHGVENLIVCVWLSSMTLLDSVSWIFPIWFCLWWQTLFLANGFPYIKVCRKASARVQVWLSFHLFGIWLGFKSLQMLMELILWPSKQRVGNEKFFPIHPSSIRVV